MDPVHEHFYKEIDYNLSILENSLNRLDQKIAQRQSEGLESVDLGFIEIFNQDIEELRSKGFDPARIAKLHSKFEILAERMTDIAFKVLDLQKRRGDIEIPLMSDKMQLKDLAKEFSPCMTKTGLETLGEHYDLYRIRGEGHCLFRALAGSYLHLYAMSSPGERGQIDDRLNQLQAELPLTGYIKKEDFITFCGILTSIHERGKDPFKQFETILKNKTTSDRLVEFFRKLAVAEAAQLAEGQEYRQVLEQHAQVESFRTLEAYFADMISMNKRTYGGELEVNACAKALGVTIKLHQPDRIGRYEQSRAQFREDSKMEERLRHAMVREFNPGSRAIGQVNLLYSPGHYDLLIAK